MNKCSRYFATSELYFWNEARFLFSIFGLQFLQNLTTWFILFITAKFTDWFLLIKIWSNHQETFDKFSLHNLNVFCLKLIYLFFFLYLKLSDILQFRYCLFSGSIYNRNYLGILLLDVHWGYATFNFFKRFFQYAQSIFFQLWIQLIFYIFTNQLVLQLISC